MGRIIKHGKQMVKFCFDKIVDGKPYPNLAKWHALPYTPEWREFSKKWPFSEPLHFLEYLDQEHIEYQLVTTPENAIYPVSLSFFDFGVDWLLLLKDSILSALRAKTCVLWFFYSEGDNPSRIRKHLKLQCAHHDVPWSQIHFTSANSAAEQLDNFSYFVDDEMLYRLRNKSDPVKFHSGRRTKKFTALVRTHKWWRAATMTRLWSKFLHNEGYFSYTLNNDVNDTLDELPFDIQYYKESFPEQINLFLNKCPFVADTLNDLEHNCYQYTVKEHFMESYLNIILETHFDVDQSGGVFLTEKTFKPIKNAQMFLIVGASGSVEQLRKMGYRTFDHVIDHRYDEIVDNTERWLAVMNQIEKLLVESDLHDLYLKCQDDIIHNQKIFLQSKCNRLNTLLGKLTK